MACSRLLGPSTGGGLKLVGFLLNSPALDSSEPQPITERPPPPGRGGELAIPVIC